MSLTFRSSQSAASLELADIVGHYARVTLFGGNVGCMATRNLYVWGQAEGLARFYADAAWREDWPQPMVWQSHQGDLGISLASDAPDQITMAVTLRSDASERGAWQTSAELTFPTNFLPQLAERLDHWADGAR